MDFGGDEICCFKVIVLQASQMSEKGRKLGIFVSEIQREEDLPERMLSFAFGFAPGLQDVRWNASQISKFSLLTAWC